MTMIAAAQLMGVLADDICARTRAHVARPAKYMVAEYESPEYKLVTHFVTYECAYRGAEKYCRRV